MNPNILGLQGPGFLNQAPTLQPYLLFWVEAPRCGAFPTSRGGEYMLMV